MLLWANKFATAEIECSLEINGRVSTLGVKFERNLKFKKK